MTDFEKAYNRFMGRYYFEIELEKIIDKWDVEFEKRRMGTRNHLGLGGISITLGMQEEIIRDLKELL